MNRGHFPGFRTPSSDFAAVKTDLQTALLWDELDLSSARSLALNTHAEKSYAGNSIYIDKKTDVGNATVIFQNDDGVKPPRVFVEPGFIARVPWTRLIIENDAQPGKVLRIFYGVDVDFVPGTSAGVQISGTVDTDVQPETYGASYASNAVLAAAANATIVAPASNVAGLLVHRATFSTYYGAAFGYGTLLAKTSAPANVVDGDLICSPFAFQWNGSTGLAQGQVEKTVRIAAGKGLYFHSLTLESGACRSVLYTLL